jgi:hypothetical protein
VFTTDYFNKIDITQRDGFNLKKSIETLTLVSALVKKVCVQQSKFGFDFSSLCDVWDYHSCANGKDLYFH